MKDVLNKKSICITGANGFIAKSFIHYFKDKYQFILISQERQNFSNSYSWNDLVYSPKILDCVDIVLNLAGANIGDKHWNNLRKKEIITSRIQSTQILVNALNTINHNAKLINASAVGIYPCDNVIYDETSPLNFKYFNSFSEEITKSWELEALKYKGNLAITRFGVVLSAFGGALQKILMPFKFGVGVGIGDGDWPFSWISLVDLLHALEQIMLNDNLNGVFNLVSPDLICYHDLIQKISDIFNPKLRFNLPKWIIKIMFGQMGQELLLQGQRVKPARLSGIEFDFKYGNINDCISAINKKEF